MIRVCGPPPSVKALNNFHCHPLVTPDTCTKGAVSTLTQKESAKTLVQLTRPNIEMLAGLVLVREKGIVIRSQLLVGADEGLDRPDLATTYFPFDAWASVDMSQFVPTVPHSASNVCA